MGQSDGASRCRSRRSRFFSSGLVLAGPGARGFPATNPVGDVGCENDELNTTDALLAAGWPGRAASPDDDCSGDHSVRTQQCPQTSQSNTAMATTHATANQATDDCHICAQARDVTPSRRSSVVSRKDPSMLHLRTAVLVALLAQRRRRHSNRTVARRAAAHTHAARSQRRRRS